ncbi:MAG TPA: iron-sulfur cluster carrier protein ApbC [Cellvibrionaceae bacterium]
MASIHDAALALLTQVPLPDGQGLTAADGFTSITTVNGQQLVQIQVGYPIDGIAVELAQTLTQVLAPLKLQIDLGWLAPSVAAANSQNAVPGVRNIVAVASGKGGVGKSTTAVNIALALAAEGARVGFLDADIYGPSGAHMLGVSGVRPQAHTANIMQPIRAHGIEMISMGNLLTDDTPVVWRGPMVSGALQQLLRNTHWDDIDYLIIDMPPGTGDIQLTLAQTIPVSGALIVTTPQDIALLDAKKGIEMFRKVQIPVMGIVENMSLHICSQCGHQEAIFGSEGGAILARDYQAPLLGQLPLQMAIREQTDAGRPPLVADPNSAVSLIYRSIARQLAARLWAESLHGAAAPSIVITND